MAAPGLHGPMEPDTYPRYQLQVWNESLAAAQRACGPAAPPDSVRRAANRLFVRACMTRRQWTARQAPADGASTAQIAVLRRALV